MGTGFGRDLFPLRSNSAVTLRLNIRDRRIIFSCNGKLIGDAFSTVNSELFDDGVSYYPAASVSSPFQAIKLRPCGFDGSVVFPNSLILQKSTSSCFSRLTAVLLTGPATDEKELSLMPWLRSPLLVGGLDEKYLHERCHLKAWNSLWNSGCLQALQDHDELTAPEPLVRGSSLDTSVDAFICQIANGDHADDSASTWKIFEGWLNETVDRDNSTLRRVLEKSKIYNFPSCERPFVAAMLKHGGLFNEALLAVSELQNGKQPAPSNDMRSLWKRVLQLRVHLRKQRQLCMSAENIPSEAENSVLSESLSPEPVPEEHAHSSQMSQTEFSEFFLDTEISWIDQRDVISAYSADYSCKILAVGLDERNSLIYIKFSARGNNSRGPLQAATDSILQLGELELKFPARKYDTNNPEQEITGFLRYEIPPEISISSMMRDDVFFTYGNNGYNSAKLSFKENFNSNSRQETDPNISFQQICEDVEQKANFLRKLVYAGPVDISRVISKASDSSMSSSEGNERWRKVVEFLRVHTSNKKEKSKIQPDRTYDDSAEDAFSTNEALKACTLFITSDGSTASPTHLLDVIQRRNLRASTRIFALESIAEILRYSNIRSDMVVLDEMLIFMKTSISGGFSEFSSGRIHYLGNLEGCTSQSFRQLQNAFLKVFLNLSEILRSYVDANDLLNFGSKNADKFIFNLISCLLSQWHIHFSSRDHKFLLESGILQVLYKLSSASFSEKVNLAYILNCSKLIALRAQCPKDKMQHYSRPYLASAMVDNILSERLSLKEIVFNLKILPERFISLEERKIIGLDEDFSTLISRDSNYITLLFQKVIALIRQREEEEKAKNDAALAEKSRREKELYDAEFVIIREAGIPLFDERRKADEVYLDGWDQIAGIRAVRASGSVVSVFATLEYNIGHGGSVSGNYFEVTILEVGTKDIGIGLGTTEHFPVSGQMPGWEAHSYGRSVALINIKINFL